MQTRWMHFLHEKNRVLKAVFLSLFLVPFTPMFAANVTWTGAGGNTLYSNPANWSGDVVPTQGNNGYFASSTTATVTFPEGGYTDMGTTETESQSDITFDVRGSWWLKPANSTWGNPTFRIGGGAHSINIESVNNAKPQMLLSNAVVRAVSTSVDITTTFQSGLINFYNPNGVLSGNSLVIGHDDKRNHIVRFETGTTSYWNNIDFRAKGPTTNRVCINGGEHHVYYNFNIANQERAGVTGTWEVAGGEFITHYFSHIGMVKGRIGCVTVSGGKWTAKRDVEIGYSDNAGSHGILTIAGGTFEQALADDNSITQTRIGHQIGNTGVVEITSGRFISTNYQTIVGCNQKSVARFNVYGGQVDTKFFHIASNPSATGSVMVTGGCWTNSGNGTVGQYGFGEMTVSGGSLTWNDWLMVASNDKGRGHLTLAGGTTQFAQILVSHYGGGDGVVDVTGGTNRYNRVQVGSQPNIRSLLRISGGTNDFYGGDGLIIGSQGGAETYILGGGNHFTQIRIGQSSNKTDIVSSLVISNGFSHVDNTINVADNIDNSGVLELNGGLLEAKEIRGWAGAICKGGRGQAHLKANGGTLRALDAASVLVHDFDSAMLGEHGLTINTAGLNLANVPQIFTNQIDANGMLLKVGTGTLTLSGANTHARTIVAEGTVAIASSGTAGNNAIVTNNAMFALVNAAPSLALRTLTLGNTSSAGWLSITPGNTLTITQENGLSITLGKLFLANAATDGTYTIFVCAGNVPITALNALDVANPATGKAYTFATTYNAGTDSTAITLTIQDKSSLSVTQRTWNGGSGSAWDATGNWIDAAIPQAGENARFPESALNKTIAIASGATAGSLAFDATSGYTLSGTDALTLYMGGRAGEITATAGAHTIAAPLALPRSVATDIRATAAVALTGEISGAGGISKMGAGALTLSGTNTFAGGIIANGGLLDIANAKSFGDAEHLHLIIADGTLRYSGEAAALVCGFTLNATSSTAPVILDVERDLALEGTFLNNNGALIKRGPGTLQLTLTAPTTLTVGNGAGSSEPQPDPIVFPADGSAPASGFTGLTVAEGTLRLIGSPDFTTRMEHMVNIGTKTLQGSVAPALELVGGRFAVGGGSMATWVGPWCWSGTVLTNAALRIFDSSITVNTLLLGAGGTCQTQTPELLIDHSTIDVYWRTGWSDQIGNTPAMTTIRNGSTLFVQQTDISLNNPFSVLIDNSTVECRNSTPTSGRVRFGGNACGTFTIANSGRLSVPRIRMESGRNEGVHIVFDGGVLQPTITEMLLFQNAGKHSVDLMDRGATFEINSALTYTVAHPLTGNGGLTKTGSGTLIFGPTMTEAGSATNMTGLVTGQYTGITRIEAGTLVVSNGALRADAAVALNTDAQLNAGGAALPLAKLSGSGTVVNGTVEPAAIAPGAQDGDIATLAVDSITCANTVFACDVQQNLTSGTVLTNDMLHVAGTISGTAIVDFGRNTADPLSVPTSFTVARYAPENGTPDVSQWRARGFGRGSVIGTFSASTGDIRVRISYTGGTALILR